ncbi:MAG: acyltransferase domain-containing protein [Crocosphaera sp.]|nr:acyltransferase domain-containing protein [Crocosphaera sp.]
MSFPEQNAHLSDHSSLAILGIGCRFPGKVHSPSELWQLLVHGVDGITEIPLDPWNIQKLYHEDKEKKGKVYVKKGIFLDKVEEFEHLLLGISPREANCLDPQQKLLLEVAWKAFETQRTLTFESLEQLEENLQAFINGEKASGINQDNLINEPRSKLAFIFSGMGKQWWAMGKGLLDEPVFREVIQQCDHYLSSLVSWSLWQEFTADENQSRVDETEIGQVSIFVLQVALASLWRSWGIEPEVIIGHSVGEVAAAHVAGVLTLEQALEVIVGRSHCQGKLAEYTTALEAIAETLEAEDILYRRLNVEVPSYSPIMDEISEEAHETLQCLTPKKPSIPLVSTVTGKFVVKALEFKKALISSQER